MKSLRTDLGRFRDLLRDRPGYRRLWISNLVSLLGDWFSYVAVTVLALTDGQGALDVALVFVAHTLPVAVLAPVAGPLADRFDRRRILLVAHCVAGLLTLAMWFAAESGGVRLLQGLLLLRVSVSSIGLTARSAAIQQLVEPSEMHAANALNGLSWSVMFAGGVALGGVVAALIGPSAAILIDAGTFLLAAGIVFGLPALAPPGEARPPVRPRELVHAWTFARPRPRILAALLSKSPIAAANSAGWVTLGIIAGDRTGLGAAGGLGLVHALRAVGTGVGPLLPEHWIRREANLSGPLIFAGVAAFTFVESPWIALPALVFWGMGTGHNWVASTAELQVGTPGHLMGRMTALDFMFASVTQSALAVGAGLLIDHGGDARYGAALGLVVGVSGWSMVMRVRRGGA